MRAYEVPGIWHPCRGATRQLVPPHRQPARHPPARCAAACFAGPWRLRGHCMRCCCSTVLPACRTAFFVALQQQPAPVRARVAVPLLCWWRLRGQGQGQCMQLCCFIVLRGRHTALAAVLRQQPVLTSVGKGGCAPAVVVPGDSRATACSVAALQCC
jgi:hypothetical protein